jgi:hypothetical protein
MIPYPVEPVKMENSQHAHQFHHGSKNKNDSNNFSACHNRTFLRAVLNCLRYFDCKIAVKLQSLQGFGIFCTGL